MTWANWVTILRIVLIIPFLYLLYLKNPNFFNISEFTAKLLAFSIFVVASFTDFLDGWLARYWNESTSLGKFLDPLADKFLVISAFIAFVQLEGGLIPFWMVLLIVMREILITTLRLTALSKTTEFETMTLGKAKTTSQMVTIIVILGFLVLRAYYYPQDSYTPPVSLYQFLDAYFESFGYFIKHTPLALMFITTVLTVSSGIRYLIKNRLIILGD